MKLMKNGFIQKKMIINLLNYGVLVNPNYWITNHSPGVVQVGSLKIVILRSRRYLIYNLIAQNKPIENK